MDRGAVKGSMGTSSRTFCRNFVVLNTGRPNFCAAKMEAILDKASARRGSCDPKGDKSRR